MSEAFVYRWRNTHTREWYIGYHKGTDTDGYICSSESALPRIESATDQWCRKILRRGSKQQMAALEHSILKKLQAKNNPRSLNRSNGAQDCVVSLADRLGYDLNLMSAEQIAQHYCAELASQDWKKIRVFDLWLIKKCIAKGTVRKPLNIDITKYLHENGIESKKIKARKTSHCHKGQG